ncbi:hypothetical protein, partial [Escherichia coli]|uniref:hypothetical protein n=1 Tax=Escherichia coli TaxID=562 RepID=UPI0013C2D6F7
RYSVSGPTAAFVVILYPVSQQFGLAGLLVATLISGVFLLLMGLALLLLWFTRWQKSGKTIFTLSWLFLLLFSLQ